MIVGGISWGIHNDFYQSMNYWACPLLETKQIWQPLKLDKYGPHCLIRNNYIHVLWKSGENRIKIQAGRV